MDPMVGIYSLQRKPIFTAGDVMTGVFIVPIKVTVKIGWMDKLWFYVPFNSISIISGRWKGEHESLCEMKRSLGSDRIDPVGRRPER